MSLELNKVYNCDCRQLMIQMIKEGIKADWLIADPPYGINMGKGVSIDGLAQSKTYLNKKWDDNKLTKDYFDLMFKCSKNQIIFGGNYYTDILPVTNSWIVWDKRIDDNQRNNFSDCELAWCSNGVARVFHYLYKGMLQGDMVNKDYRFHPTQKPTQLIIKILKYYTKENDLILDPFMGSFTTAVSCYKMQRKFIGAELDKEYFDKGSARLKEVMNQISIFDLI